MYFNEFQPAFEQLKRSIDSIHDINMQAVVRKSRKTRQDAQKTIDSMAGIGVFCLILAFAYFWYFPLVYFQFDLLPGGKNEATFEKIGDHHG